MPHPVPPPSRAEPGDGRPVAVWELDGVLTRRATLLPFLRRVAGIRPVVSAVAVALPRESTTAVLLQRTLGGLAVADVDRVARAYATRVAARLRPDAAARWRWHRDQGHRLVIASASPDLYVRPLGRQLGADTVVCTELTVVNGHLTGAVRGGPCRGAEKARRVLADLTEHPAGKVWVYANPRTDQPLLALADVPVRVALPVRLISGHAAPGRPG